MISRNNGMPGNLGNLAMRAGLGDRPLMIDLRCPNNVVELSASEFDQLVKAFARGIRNLGLKTGDRVGFLTQNRWEMLVGYFGAMYFGAVAVPINYKFSLETIHHIISDSDIGILFTDEEHVSAAPDSIKAISFDDSGVSGFEAFLDGGDIAAFDPDDDDLAEILYTSGSTGQPKGVPLNHCGQLWALSKYIEPLDAGAADNRSLIVAPFYHMNALFYASVHLLNGAAIVCLPKFDARRYADAIVRYQCTHLSGVPSIFAMIAALDPEQRAADMSCVKRIGIGSAPLSTSLLKQVESLFPLATISNSYGTTEAGPAIFTFSKEGKMPPSLSVGYPLDDVQWRLVGDETAHEGLFEIKTPALTTGYLHRPDADSERFGNGWFKTNDIMRYDEEGFFYFVSRADDMFICGGENIYPSEVEAILNWHPAVQQSVVVGAPDDIKGMVPVAFVVIAPDKTSCEAEIKTFCLESGPVYAHPRRVVFKETLPLGGTHKIDRKSLEREAIQLMQSCGRATPQSSRSEGLPE